MTHQPRKQPTPTPSERAMIEYYKRYNARQTPRQPTQDLFERLSREQIVITLTVLCGDTIEGHITWVDLIGFQFKALDNVNYYFPKRNIQSISWV